MPHLHRPGWLERLVLSEGAEAHTLMLRRRVTQSKVSNILQHQLALQQPEIKCGSSMPSQMELVFHGKKRVEVRWAQPLT